MTPSPDWRTKIIGPERPEDLGEPYDSLMEWVASHPETDFMTQWEEAINPGWLPYLAQAGGATKEQLVMASCAVARLCLHLVIPNGEERPRIAIETAEAWARGEATEEQVLDASRNATNALDYEVWQHPIREAYYAIDAASYAYDAVTWACSTLSTSRAGIESRVVCATLRKFLPFERPPRPKGLTIWQRLAKESE